MGNFRPAQGWTGGGQKAPPPPPSLLKICHSYPTMMTLGIVIPYLKKVQKNKFKSLDTRCAEISILFHQKSANFAISRNTDTDCILTLHCIFHLHCRLHFALTSFESLKILLINMVTTLM